MKPFVLFAIFCFSFLQGRSENYRVIVYDFSVLGLELKKDDGTIVSNSIRSYLKSIVNDDITILEREEIAKLLLDRSKSQKLPDIYDRSTAVKIGGILEANYVIFGKVSKSSAGLFDGVMISARIVKISDGTIVNASEQKIEKNNPYDIAVRNIVSQLMEPFGLIKPMGARVENDIKSYLVSYNNKFKNVISPNDSKFNDIKNDIMLASGVIPGKKIIAVIVLDEYNNYSNTMEANSFIVINYDGVFIQFDVYEGRIDASSVSPPLPEFFEERLGKHNYSFDWNALLSTSFNLKSIETNNERNWRTNQETGVKHSFLRFGEDLILADIESENYNMNIFDLFNILNTIKNIAKSH